MKATFIKDNVTFEKVEQALSVIQSRLPLLSIHTGLCWDPSRGAWIGSIISRTIDYCNILAQSKTMPSYIKEKAASLKLQYEEELARYNNSNPHFPFFPKSFLDYETA